MSTDFYRGLHFAFLHFVFRFAFRIFLHFCILKQTNKEKKRNEAKILCFALTVDLRFEYMEIRNLYLTVIMEGNKSDGI